jgi:hypothetical protein
MAPSSIIRIFTMSYGLACIIGGLMHFKQGIAPVLVLSGVGVIILSLESFAYLQLETHNGSRSLARNLIRLQGLAGLCICIAMAHRFYTILPSKPMPAIPIAVLSGIMALASIVRAEGLRVKEGAKGARGD